MDVESIFRMAHREVRPFSPVPDIKVEFFPFAGMNHTARLEDHTVHVRVCDILADAPAEVYRSLALILFGRLYKKKIDRIHHKNYRSFILRDDMQQRARLVRAGRGRVQKGGGPKGRFVDLDEVFDRLNKEYFAGALPKPLLSWSGRVQRCVLGRYDRVRDAIVVSRMLDSPHVPRVVTDYVLFHEMLHLKHETCVRKSRLVVHTPEFRADERRFIHRQEAERWLAQL